MLCMYCRGVVNKYLVRDRCKCPLSISLNLICRSAVEVSLADCKDLIVLILDVLTM